MFDKSTPYGQYVDQLKDAPAWAISLAVHAAILMLMASITYVVNSPDNSLMLSSTIDQVDEQQFLFDATVSDQVGTNASFDTLSASLSMTKDPTLETENPVDEQLQEELLDVNVPMAESIAKPSDSELVESVEVAGQTEHTGGTEGAMDRLTFEIASSLNDKPTLVIWLFDASNSLNEHREMIANRFETVYKQLGMLDRNQDKGRPPLETAVVSFGEKTKFVTEKPVSDVKDLIKAVRDIQPDESGIEHTFEAIDQVSKRWQSYRTKLRRNVMIILVTDERGDDPEKLDNVIAFNKRYGIRVFCVGHAAPFGREQVFVNYTWEENGQSFTMDLPADVGPETFYPERLQLPFWGGRNQYLDRMSSSYGPYALTRLCAETGGLYLVNEELNMVQDAKQAPRFDHAIMRNYSPDYRPIRLQDQDIKQNQAMQAVIMASQLSKVNSVPLPTLSFRADTDNALRQALTEAQKPLAVLDYHLNELMAILEKGVKDRDKLTRPRWRAGFDLAMGRVLAMRARAMGYNEMAAEMKSSPKKFESKDNNHWRMVPSEKVSTSATVRKLASQADEYLSRVINEHPGTPWEMLADRERQQPLGWEWQEFRRELAPSNPNDPNAPRLLLAEEEERQRRMNNPPPKPKNIPRL